LRHKGCSLLFHRVCLFAAERAVYKGQKILFFKFTMAARVPGAAIEESTKEKFEGHISHVFFAISAGGQRESEAKFNAGNAVILPEHVLSELVFFEAPTPYIFELYHERSGRWTHVTVREFTQPDDGTCKVPRRVFETLGAAGARERVMLRYVQLPLARGVTLQVTPDPDDYARFVGDVNNRVRQFICATQGDVFSVQSAQTIYSVSVASVAPEAVRAVALISQDERREVEISVTIVSPGEGRAKKRDRPFAPSKTVLRLPPYDYSGPVALDTVDNAPRRAVWFMGWRMPGEADVLAFNPYSPVVRLTVRDTECDVCGNALLREAAEELQFLPPSNGTLWPLAALALHKAGDLGAGKEERAGDDRLDGIDMPAPRSLDVRHLECLLIFAARKFADTESDFLFPSFALEIPNLQLYPGQKMRTTLAWERLPERWLMLLLLSQTVSVQEREGQYSKDYDPGTEPLGRPFLSVVSSLAARGVDARARAWAKGAREILLHRLENDYSASAATRTLRARFLLQVSDAKSRLARQEESEGDAGNAWEKELERNLEFENDEDYELRLFRLATIDDRVDAAQKLLQDAAAPLRDDVANNLFTGAAVENSTDVMRYLMSADFFTISQNIYDESLDSVIEEIAYESYLYLNSNAFRDFLQDPADILSKAVEEGAREIVSHLLVNFDFDAEDVREEFGKFFTAVDVTQEGEATQHSQRDYLAILGLLFYSNRISAFGETSVRPFHEYLEIAFSRFGVAFAETAENILDIIFENSTQPSQKEIQGILEVLLSVVTQIDPEDRDLYADELEFLLSSARDTLLQLTKPSKRFLLKFLAETREFDVSDVVFLAMEQENLLSDSEIENEREQRAEARR